MRTTSDQDLGLVAVVVAEAAMALLEVVAVVLLEVLAMAAMALDPGQAALQVEEGHQLVATVGMAAAAKPVEALRLLSIMSWLNSPAQFMSERVMATRWNLFRLSVYRILGLSSCHGTDMLARHSIVC